MKTFLLTSVLLIYGSGSITFGQAVSISRIEGELIKYDTTKAQVDYIKNTLGTNSTILSEVAYQVKLDCVPALLTVLAEHNGAKAAAVAFKIGFSQTNIASCAYLWSIVPKKVWTNAIVVVDSLEQASRTYPINSFAFESLLSEFPPDMLKRWYFSRKGPELLISYDSLIIWRLLSKDKLLPKEIENRLAVMQTTPGIPRLVYVLIRLKTKQDPAKDIVTSVLEDESLPIYWLSVLERLSNGKVKNEEIKALNTSETRKAALLEMFSK